jgi:hypothetical protein
LRRRINSGLLRIGIWQNLFSIADGSEDLTAKNPSDGFASDFGVSRGALVAAAIPGSTVREGFLSRNDRDMPGRELGMKVWRWIDYRRVLIAIAATLFVCQAASAQVCPQPYTPSVSPQTGNVCVSNCAAGSFPTVTGNQAACEPGYAPPTCPGADEFVVMTPTGLVCQKGYTPIAANGGVACSPGDLRVERPPYQLNGALAYETCTPAPNCPSGYIEAVDPDDALGTTRVCLMPCQDFAMNQSMACSCGQGGRLATQAPGAPVKQICQPICPAGSNWVPSSPLYAFTAQGGQCQPASGGPPVATEVAEPACPAATYWNGQVCVPIGGGNGGLPIIGYRGCPPGTHWNGSHCVPDTIVLPVCPPGSIWNGLFCVPIAPQPCPIFTRWNGSRCEPIIVQRCPPGEIFDGMKCVPRQVICVPPRRLINGRCELADCPPPQQFINGRCQLPPTQACPPPKLMINGVCVERQSCFPPNEFINGKCEPPCPPPRLVINGVCVERQSCFPPNELVNGKCEAPCPPPRERVNGICELRKPEGCMPPNEFINGKCEPPCPPPRERVNGICELRKPEGCMPPNHLVNGKCVPEGDANCPPPRRIVNGRCELRK